MDSVQASNSMDSIETRWSFCFHLGYEILGIFKFGSPNDMFPKLTCWFIFKKNVFLIIWQIFLRNMKKYFFLNYFNLPMDCWRKSFDGFFWRIINGYEEKIISFYLFELFDGLVTETLWQIFDGKFWRFFDRIWKVIFLKIFKLSNESLTEKLW